VLVYGSSVTVPQLDTLRQLDRLQQQLVQDVFNVIRTHPPSIGQSSQRRVETVEMKHKGAVVTLHQWSYSTTPVTNEEESGG